MKRRSFLQQTLAGTALLGSAVFVSAQPSTPSSSPAPTPPREPARGEPLDPEMVKTFVSAGHRDLAKIKELLALYPLVLNATVDLGKGDWESALGAASHTGNKPIAQFLMDAGARPDVFCAAMMGERDVVLPVIKFSPQAANARGPHGLTLLYHVGYRGDLKMAEAMRPHIAEPARHCNQALQSATGGGHTEFVAWLLKNGVDNPNLKAFGKTPLDVATEKGFTDLADLLRAHGAVRSS
jgi:ankyrin repeat protein